MENVNKGFLAPAWNKWYNAPRSRKRMPGFAFGMHI